MPTQWCNKCDGGYMNPTEIGGNEYVGVIWTCEKCGHSIEDITYFSEMIEE